MDHPLVDTVPGVDDDAANWRFAPAQDGIPAHYVYQLPIQKSPADDREYSIIHLENGLEAVLVHDEKADKAAASLDVAIGGYNDPDDIPGLAHFCEHLLFMGSERFPKENEYDEFLTKNSGESNAYTSCPNTNFFFSVASNALEGALERFSSFFHSPLFSESSTMREINVVDSEWASLRQDDDYRLGQIINHFASLGHPLRKFNCGNKKTLIEATRLGKSRSKSKKGRVSDSPKSVVRFKDGQGPNETSTNADSADVAEEEDAAGLETRSRLVEWWSKEYCASRMSLVVVGKESLDDLTSLVATLFSPIKYHGQDPTPSLPPGAYGKDELCKIVHAKTINDVYSITLVFPVPYQVPLWRVKPANFLARLIGHKGTGSLHAYLKNKGWISALKTKVVGCGRGLSLFQLGVDLTKDGFKNYREVIVTCFKFINLLCQSKLPNWAQDEIRTLAELEFRFEEKSDSCAYALHVADTIKQPVPRALLLSGPILTWEWDEYLLQSTLAHLVIENCLILIAAQDHSVLGKNGHWHTEPWFGTQYMEEQLNSDLIAAIHEANDIPELSLPKPNEFIPTNIDVAKVDVAEPQKQPSLIRRTKFSEVWHKKDDQFWVPRAFVIIDARTPVAGISARAVVLTRLFTKLVNDALSEYSYDADLAGLSYNFSPSSTGFKVDVVGYNDKLPVLAQRVLSNIRSLDIKEDRLAVMKEQMEQDLSNAMLDEPYMLARADLSYLLAERDPLLRELLEEKIQEISAQELREHIEMLLSQLKYTILVNGNFCKEDALRIADMVENTLGAGPLPSEIPLTERSRLLPEPCNYIWERTVVNQDEVNSSVSYCLQIGNVSDSRVRVICHLLDQILQQATFNILRTQEQLGYFVVSSVAEDVELIAWGALIQGEKDPRYFESRIEAFLVHMRGTLEVMEEEVFEEHKQSLVNAWLQKLQNLGEETVRFRASIHSGYLDFLRHERDAELVQKVTKKDVLTLFKERFDPSSETRIKLSVHYRSQRPPALNVSDQAAQKWLALLKKVGAEVDEDEFNAVCEDEPPVEEVKAYWAEAFREQGVDEKFAHRVLNKFDHLVGKYPVASQEAVELGPNVVYIKDGTAFRDSLYLSEFARPVEKFEVES